MPNLRNNTYLSRQTLAPIPSEGVKLASEWFAKSISTLEERHAEECRTSANLWQLPSTTARNIREPRIRIPQ